MNATGLGNVISNDVEASIKSASTVTADTGIVQSAHDGSSIDSIGLSFAGSGGLAGSAIVAVNDIGNTISARIDGSTASSGSTIQLSALSDVDMFSFVGGVAGAGIGAANLSLAVNKIHNAVDASIIDSGNSRYVQATGNISLT